MKLKLSSLLIASTLFGAAVTPAQANSDAMLELLKVLRDKGTISVQDYELLTHAAEADKEAINVIDTKAEKAADTGVKITTKGKLKIEDKNGDWSFQPIGRIMWDAIDTDEDNSGQPGFQGTELRRARLGFQGTIYDWGYKFSVGFVGGGVSVKDAYLSYNTKLADTRFGFKLGQSHIPFGLNTKVSSKSMTFIDRPFFADSVISPARENGAVSSLAAQDYRWLLGIGLTNGGLDNGSTDNNGSSLSIRGSFVPFMKDKTHLIQIGAGYLTKGGGDDFRFRQRLVSHKDATRHLDTGTISDFDGANAFTVDAMGIYGSFHTKAEYLDYEIDRGTGGSIDISGYAVEAGYFLSGESLKWKKGYTSGITPNASTGAWEIATRFESIEIDQLSTDDEADKWTLGLNYYPTKNTRLMLNYDHVTALTVNGINVDFEPSSLKFRAQAYW